MVRNTKQLVTISGRHIDITPEMREHIIKKTKRFEKYFYQITEIHVVLSGEKDRKQAEITVYGDHQFLKADVATPDLHGSINEAVDKVIHQARRLHSKRISDKKRFSSKITAEASEKGRSLSIATNQVVLDYLDIEDAVKIRESTKQEILPFRNKQNDKITLLHRQKNKWILTELE